MPVLIDCISNSDRRYCRKSYVLTRDVCLPKFTSFIQCWFGRRDTTITIVEHTTKHQLLRFYIIAGLDSRKLKVSSIESFHQISSSVSFPIWIHQTNIHSFILDYLLNHSKDVAKLRVDLNVSKTTTILCNVSYIKRIIT